MKCSIIFLLPFILLFSCTDGAKMQYESQLPEILDLIEEHNEFVDINENIYDSDVHKGKVDLYLAWVDEHREQLEGFKKFIEANYQELKGTQQVAVRDTLKLLLEDMDRNEKNFKRYNKIWERYH
jgi:DNA gyrase/topoisomerase IV subunit B